MEKKGGRSSKERKILGVLTPDWEMKKGRSLPAIINMKLLERGMGEEE